MQWPFEYIGSTKRSRSRCRWEGSGRRRGKTSGGPTWCAASSVYARSSIACRLVSFRLSAKPGGASHGERSRVYMARALLQGADLVILDESLAELDLGSVLQALPAAVSLSKSLLVVAHG
jgi:ABC-type transport system involved in cytochrome bd biosynthesis fused ATPase/permease subunit